jgi:hypothetical protein
MQAACTSAHKPHAICHSSGCTHPKNCWVHQHLELSKKAEHLKLLFGESSFFISFYFSLKNTRNKYASAARLSFHSIKAGLAWLSLSLELLSIMLNIGGTPITSKSHTYPSHS